MAGARVAVSIRCGVVSLANQEFLFQEVEEMDKDLWVSHLLSPIHGRLLQVPREFECLRPKMNLTTPCFATGST
jgi:hypothetical protein